MGAHHGADGIDLQQAEPVENFRQVAAGYRTCRARLGKALRGDRNAAGERKRDFFLHMQIKTSLLFVAAAIATTAYAQAAGRSSTRLEQSPDTACRVIRHNFAKDRLASPPCLR